MSLLALSASFEYLCYVSAAITNKLFFQCVDRLYTLESDVFISQILTPHVRRSVCAAGSDWSVQYVDNEYKLIASRRYHSGTTTRLGIQQSDWYELDKWTWNHPFPINYTGRNTSHQVTNLYLNNSNSHIKCLCVVTIGFLYQLRQTFGVWILELSTANDVCKQYDIFILKKRTL